MPFDMSRAPEDVAAKPLMGPAPCHDCHASLFYMRSGSWMERHWRGSPIPVPEFKVHHCTAAGPQLLAPPEYGLTALANVHNFPKLGGLQILRGQA